MTTIEAYTLDYTRYLYNLSKDKYEHYKEYEIVVTNSNIIEKALGVFTKKINSKDVKYGETYNQMISNQEKKKDLYIVSDSSRGNKMVYELDKQTNILNFICYGKKIT